MCLAQGPQRSEAGEATEGLKMHQAVKSVLIKHHPQGAKIVLFHIWLTIINREQAAVLLGSNSHPRHQNFALNGTQGRSGGLPNKFFFRNFIQSPHKRMLW